MSIGPVTTQFFDLTANGPFPLVSGEPLDAATIAYETYGTLNEDASNAILLFHALTGSQHAAGFNPQVAGVDGLWTEDCWTGWWDNFIGPGKALDTDRFFIICANYLGSCYGSTGPLSINPKTGKIYGYTFPRVNALDILHSQLQLVDHLGIEQLHAVVGSSLGGMLTLLLCTRFPQRVKIVITMATGLEVTILQRIHNFEQIMAIRNDPNFKDGDYDHSTTLPSDGLALARIISHKTFVSLGVMEGRARQQIASHELIGHFYSLSDVVESYMLHQGQKFAERFDANSYLRVMDMWQHFPIMGNLDPDTLVPCQHQQHLVFSIDSDVCYYPEEQLAIVQLLKAADINVKYITVHSDKGHDSFLLEPELYAPYIQFVLDGLDDSA
jgi:homoserine O-acetyltransferase